MLETDPRFADFVATRGDALLRYAYLLTGNPHDAADLVQEALLKLWSALAELPRKQRAVLVLRYYEQLADAEIASVLGVSRGTVRSQASRALDKLRSVLPADTDRSTL
ncbi:sigma-70 family RNA polymerase sigma factor [Nonomuraea sp. NPDC002799]